jgi:hypothetical protein
MLLRLVSAPRSPSTISSLLAAFLLPYQFIRTFPQKVKKRRQQSGCLLSELSPSLALPVIPLILAPRNTRSNHWYPDVPCKIRKQCFEHPTIICLSEVYDRTNEIGHTNEKKHESIWAIRNATDEPRPYSEWLLIFLLLWFGFLVNQFDCGQSVRY